MSNSGKGLIHRAERNEHDRDIAVLYSGGTISSIVTSEGYKDGGREIDLLSKMPQPVEGFNIYHVAFPFTGLSENLTALELEAIGNSVQEVLDKGKE